MLIKILFFVASGVAGFVIAYYSGNKAKSIFLPAVVAGIIALFPVLTDPKAFGFFGPIGLVVIIALASIIPAIGAALGSSLGFVARNLKQSNSVSGSIENPSSNFSSYALKFKKIYLTPKNVNALITSSIGLLLIVIAYFVMQANYENISSNSMIPILLLNPLGIILFLLGINKILKK
jgi:hypothetical protein